MTGKWSACALALAMWAGGCGGSEAPAVPAPEDPAGRMAASVLNDCRGGGPDREMACHEAAVLDVLDREGVAAAMALAERMGDLDGEVKRQGHVYAHAIGLAAYTTPDEVGRVFESCTASYQSGCYHGVIQSYFADVADETGAGIDADVINGLCADQRGETGDAWLLFQCAHGIGHGVTMINDHHLPDALAACDLVTSAWERDACYGGAFMENIMQATAPHHSMGRPQAESGEMDHSEHADHAAAAPAAAAASFPGLKPDEPLYPCTVLPERYLNSCYHMQTSAVLFYNGGDFRAAADACDTAPERFQAACFRSLGRDVSAVTVQEHPRALELCGTMGDRRADCYWGYVKNVVDVTAQASDGFEFCAIVPDPAGKQTCYEAVGEQVWALMAEESGREEMCATADAAYVQACRRGAGLPDSAPAARRGAGGGTR